MKRFIKILLAIILIVALLFMFGTLFLVINGSLNVWLGIAVIWFTVVIINSVYSIIERMIK